MATRSKGLSAGASLRDARSLPHARLRKPPRCLFNPLPGFSASFDNRIRREKQIDVSIQPGASYVAAGSDFVSWPNCWPKMVEKVRAHLALSGIGEVRSEVAYDFIVIDVVDRLQPTIPAESHVVWRADRPTEPVGKSVCEA